MNEFAPKPYIFTHCFRKTRFVTEVEAQREVQRLIRTHGAAKCVGLRAYSCEFCEGWHVGKQWTWKGD